VDATYRFSTYRDAMEAVHNFEGVLLACLVIAFEEVTARSNLFERIEVRWWICAFCARSVRVSVNVCAWLRRVCDLSERDRAGVGYMRRCSTAAEMPRAVSVSMPCLEC
jgi:hypothetical protein